MDAQSMLKMQAIMFLLMAAGIWAKRKGLMTDAGKQCLTDMILHIIVPCNIVYAFAIIDGSAMQTFGTVLLIGIVTEIASILLSMVLYRRLAKGEQTILKYATVCSNAGFMGNAIAEGLFGSIGMVYTSIYLIPQRLFMWSVGVSYFSGGGKDKKAIFKALAHPCLIAVYIGIAIMTFRIPVPEILLSAIKKSSDCCTALSMFVIGAILTEVDFRTVFSKKTMLFSALRLIGIPALTLGVCMLAGADPLVTGVAVILAGMPAGATTSILAANYNVEERFAAKIVVLTTALSMVTIPIWGLVLIATGMA